MFRKTMDDTIYLSSVGLSGGGGYSTDLLFPCYETPEAVCKTEKISMKYRPNCISVINVVVFSLHFGLVGGFNSPQ